MKNKLKRHALLIGILLCVADYAIAKEPVELVIAARVVFSYKSDIPNNEGLAALGKLTERIKNNMRITSLTIVGHTDNIGNENSNLILSTARAETVRQYLDRIIPHKGVDFDVKGVGENQPIGSNETEQGRIQNRRVDIEITGEKVSSLQQ